MNAAIVRNGAICLAPVLGRPRKSERKTCFSAKRERVRPKIQQNFRAMSDEVQEKRLTRLEALFTEMQRLLGEISADVKQLLRSRK